MRFSAPLLTVTGTVAGIAAAFIAYQSAASVGMPAAPASVSPAAITTTWLPCDRGWELKGNICVKEQEKVVVTHDPSAPNAVPARTAGARSSPGEHDEHADDDESGHEHAHEHLGHDDVGEHD